MSRDFTTSTRRQRGRGTHHPVHRERRRPGRTDITRHTPTVCSLRGPRRNPGDFARSARCRLRGRGGPCVARVKPSRERIPTLGVQTGRWSSRDTALSVINRPKTRLQVEQVECFGA